jgi:hypothetical protein
LIQKQQHLTNEHIMEHLTGNQINQLVENEQVDLMAHLDSCESCMVKYQTALEIHQGLKQMDYHSPSMRFAKNIIELISRKEALDKSNRFWVGVVLGCLLLSILIVFVFSSYWIFINALGQGVTSMLLQWHVIVILTIIGAWVLYFLDKWMGKRMMKDV